MGYNNITIPEKGEKITVNPDFSLNVPDCPVIPYIEGDGIGVEVIDAALKVLERIDAKYSLGVETQTALVGGTAYDQTGTPLPDETLTLAKEADAVLKYIDCNGALLEAGDTVTLVKDLVVKGGGFTAKRGTAVRRILLDHKNAENIEGRVNGQHIVILTKYVKKA